ncbi:MAG: DMT family transporter, partial [Eubacteriales bacterium]|nr:DMT family transporter [Eubacteriales bacterium]
MTKETKATIQMLICATLWSIAGIFMKLLPWNGFAVASLRSLFAGLTISIYILISGRKFILNKKTILSGILTGCVYICFACANKLTTSANAIVLQFTSPVFIVIFSAVFFGQKIRKADLITVIITLLGIALFFFDKLETGYILGNIVSIGAGMFMAG